MVLRASPRDLSSPRFNMGHGCVRVCVSVCVHACVCARVRVCVCVCLLKSNKLSGMLALSKHILQATPSSYLHRSVNEGTHTHTLRLMNPLFLHHTHILIVNLSFLTFREA